MNIMRKPLIAAIALTGITAFAGAALAQSTSTGATGSGTAAGKGPSTSPSMTPPTLPSTTPQSSGTISGTTSAGTTGAGTAASGTGTSAGTSAGGTSASGTAGMTGTTSTRSMPARTETADSALRKLDATNKGYVSKEDVQSLTGFDFTVADSNHDGRLSKDEFNKAWGTYSSNK